MKKLTSLDLELLARELPIVDRDEQCTVVGGCSYGEYGCDGGSGGMYGPFSDGYAFGSSGSFDIFNGGMWTGGGSGSFGDSSGVSSGSCEGINYSVSDFLGDIGQSFQMMDDYLYNSFGTSLGHIATGMGGWDLATNPDTEFEDWVLFGVETGVGVAAGLWGTITYMSYEAMYNESEELREQVSAAIVSFEESVRDGSFFASSFGY